jgi:hypothetical protein
MFADSGEDGEAVVLLGDVVDKFLDKDRFAHAGASEKSDLSPFQIRFEKVNDLDSRIKDFPGGGKILEFRRFPVDRQAVRLVQIVHSVNGIPHDIHNPAADLGSYRH